MLEKVWGCSIDGVIPQIIQVEIDLQIGIGLKIVGGVSSGIKESIYRIISALKNSGQKFPGRKITINFAPVNITKKGSQLDLAIALGVLAAHEKLNLKAYKDYLILGELSLDGTLKPIQGVLSIAIEAVKKGYKGIILPKSNLVEASHVVGLKYIGINSIREFIDITRGRLEVPSYSFSKTSPNGNNHADFNEIQGMQQAKRALMIAAVGRHNILFSGPPGIGKSLLIKSYPGILPPLSKTESMEVSSIYSIMGLLDPNQGLKTRAPIRNPHHLISASALIGGGNNPIPGEISLAHHGVLFLDEFNEFPKKQIESLREPLEHQLIHIDRLQKKTIFPCDFQLIGCFNPKQNATKGFSSAIEDRIDMMLSLNKNPKNTQSDPSLNTRDMSKNVLKARNIQNKRYQQSSYKYNSRIPYGNLKQWCLLNKDSEQMLNKLKEKLDYSPRAIHKILRVARSIADLDLESKVSKEHILEAAALCPRSQKKA
ncbi:MAG: YifB family Mg chelatase-like AAA ATPase [Flavobacteriaceae bacterium]